MRPELDGVGLSDRVLVCHWSPEPEWRITVGPVLADTTAVNTLTRLDWVVDRDEYIQVVAMNNGGTNYPHAGQLF